MNDVKVLVCQYKEDTAVCAKGATGYVIQHDAKTNDVHILVFSRSRRWVEKEKDGALLTDFKLRTLPGTHPLRMKNIYKVRAEDNVKVRALQELADSLQLQHA